MHWPKDKVMQRESQVENLKIVILNSHLTLSSSMMSLSMLSMMSLSMFQNQNAASRPFKDGVYFPSKTVWALTLSHKSAKHLSNSDWRKNCSFCNDKKRCPILFKSFLGPIFSSYNMILLVWRRAGGCSEWGGPGPGAAQTSYNQSSFSINNAWVSIADD